MFIEEVLSNWKNHGKIFTSFPKERVRELIMQSLRNTVRFNGLTTKRYTTMAHSYLVACMASDLAEIDGIRENDRLDDVVVCGLMHDIGECIIGDIVYPIKNKLFQKEYQLLQQIEEDFRIWAGKEIFNIENFTKKWNSYCGYVNKADSIIGLIELLGVSTDGDFQTKEFFEKCFNVSNRDLEIEYEKLFEYLVKKSVKSSNKTMNRYEWISDNFIITDKDERYDKFMEEKEKTGVSPDELWNLDIATARFILPRLKQFRENNNGHPVEYTIEQWNEILDKIIWSFEKIDSGGVFDVEDGFEGSEKEWYDKIQVGLTLFGEHLMSLWN